MIVLRISRRFGLVMPAMLLALGACTTAASIHPVVTADLGTVSRASVMEASLSQPGVVAFQRVKFAQWTAGRGMFIDRNDLRTASVAKGMEEASIYAYVIDHPRFGRYLIDSGVSRKLQSKLNPFMRRAVGDLKIEIEQTTAEWLSHEMPPCAVFLTHLHFDHVGGLMDLPPSTQVYAGEGDAQDHSLANRVTGRPADIALEGYGPLHEWRFGPDPDGVFAGVIDVFGDGAVWALRLPGHSPGSTGYLINSADGPKLVVGDAVQTRLGWEEGMPQPLPSSARADAELTADRLRRWAAAHPQVEVFLGHQSRTRQAE